MINILNDCAAACSHCATACLGEQDIKMMADCIRLDLDCAQICNVGADYLARASARTAVLLQTCAGICEACANECSKHTRYAHCQDCANKCLECAAACRNYL